MRQIHYIWRNILNHPNSTPLIIFSSTLLPVMTRLHTAGQLSNALHLHVGNLVLQSIVLSGRQRTKGEFGNFKSYLNCVTVVQLDEVLSPASDSHLGLQPKIFVRLLLTQT